MIGPLMAIASVCAPNSPANANFFSGFFISEEAERNEDGNCQGGEQPDYLFGCPEDKDLFGLTEDEHPNYPDFINDISPSIIPPMPVSRSTPRNLLKNKEWVLSAKDDSVEHLMPDPLAQDSQWELDVYGQGLSKGDVAQTKLRENVLFRYELALRDDALIITKHEKDVAKELGVAPEIGDALKASVQSVVSLDDEQLKSAYTDVLTSGDVSQAKLAAEQSTSSSSGAVTQALISSSNTTTKTVSARLASVRGKGTNVAGLRQSGISSGDDVRRSGFWVKASGGLVTQGDVRGVAGYDGKTYGTTIGLDTMSADEDVRTGLAVSYSKSDINGNGGGQEKTSIDSYQTALYGSYEPGEYFVEGQLALAFNNVNTARRITFGGLDRTAKGTYDAIQHSASLGAGVPLFWENWALTPKAGLFYSYTRPESYKETGAGGSNLTINPGDTQILEGSLGATVAYEYRVEDGSILRPELRAAALYEFLGDDGTATAKYSGSGATFKTPGIEPFKFGGTAGLGIAYTTADGQWEVRADYDAEIRKDYISHNGMVTGRLNF